MSSFWIHSSLLAFACLFSSSWSTARCLTNWTSIFVVSLGRSYTKFCSFGDYKSCKGKITFSSLKNNKINDIFLQIYFGNCSSILGYFSYVFFLLMCDEKLTFSRDSNILLCRNKLKKIFSCWFTFFLKERSFQCQWSRVVDNECSFLLLLSQKREVLTSFCSIPPSFEAEKNWPKRCPTKLYKRHSEFRQGLSLTFVSIS